MVASYAVPSLKSSRRTPAPQSHNHTPPAATKRGATDEFEIEEAAPLGPELVAVTIGHDGRGASPAWRLERVAVARLPDGPTFHFPCGAWLGQPGPQQKGEEAVAAAVPVEVRLAAGPAPPPAAPGATAAYTVAVVTGDVRGAGTDADVHMALHGAAPHGEPGGAPMTTGAVALSPGAFARGGRDVFRLRLPRVGAVARAVVGIGARGASPSWHLAALDVTEDATGESWHFEGAFGGK